MPKTAEYYIIMRPGEQGDDTVLLNSSEGPQVQPVFTQEAKANHFLKMWKASRCHVRSVGLSDLLEHLRWVLLKGVPRLTIDPDSSSAGETAEILHFLAEMESEPGD
jgi:hypothetical protein